NAGEGSGGSGVGGQGADGLDTEGQGADSEGAGRAGGGGYHEVALADAAEAFALPAQFGLSAPGGLLGGALPGYRIYEAAPAGGAPTHVAFAALEPHFMARAMQLLGVDGTEEQFAATFKTKTGRMGGLGHRAGRAHRRGPRGWQGAELT